MRRLFAVPTGSVPHGEIRLIDTGMHPAIALYDPMPTRGSLDRHATYIVATNIAGPLETRNG